MILNNDRRGRKENKNNADGRKWCLEVNVRRDKRGKMKNEGTKTSQKTKSNDIYFCGFLFILLKQCKMKNNRKKAKQERRKEKKKKYWK